MKNFRFFFLNIAIALAVSTTFFSTFPAQAARSCVQLFSSTEYTEFQNVDLNVSLSAAVTEALAAVQIPRPGLFTPAEVRKFENADRPIDLLIGSAHIEEPQSGVLVDPEHRGAVVSHVSPNIKPERSELLYQELQRSSKVGNLLMFAQDGLDKNMLSELRAEGMNPERMPDGYSKVPDKVFIEKFIGELARTTNISGKQKVYVRTILKNMVETARKTMGPNYQKKLNGIRMRWKDEGRGADFDTVHTDSPAASIATTLSLFGAGTEVFYGDDKSIEVIGVPVNSIASLLGEASGYPAVKHRASTLLGRRITFLIFWN